MSKKIAVVAANGRAAQKIISEAVERGLDVDCIWSSWKQYTGCQLCAKRRF